MKLRSVLLPIPVLLSLYACATAGEAEGDDDSKPLPAVEDAGSDASTRRDSGPASPPRDGGSSSGGSSSGGSSSGGSSSGGATSSSSGGSGQAAMCPDEMTAFIVTTGVLTGTTFPGVTEIDSCAECNAPDPGCCAKLSVGGGFLQKFYCWDIAGGAPGLPDGGF